MASRRCPRRRISFKGSLSEAQVRESSLGLLQGYLGDTVDAIVGSVDKCPPLMRAAFKQLRRRVEEQFPSEQHEVGATAGPGGGHKVPGGGRAPSSVPLPQQEVRYFSISGFLFLRFFAPAVLTPKLFGLREQHADPRTGRTLLLLAKVWGARGRGHRGGTGTPGRDGDTQEGQGHPGGMGSPEGTGTPEATGMPLREGDPREAGRPRGGKGFP